MSNGTITACMVKRPTLTRIVVSGTSILFLSGVAAAGNAIAGP